MGLIERRIGLLSAIFLLFFVLALGRAAKLMVVDHASLKSRAAGQQVGDVTVPAPRGAILDRNGNELAVSTDAADISATPYIVKDVPAAAAKLAPLIQHTPEDIAAKLADRKKGFVYLARGIKGRDAQKIRKLAIGGIDVTPTTQRFYPSKTLAAQLLGFVGTEGGGLSGLENSWDKDLHGTDGERRTIKDGAGDPISTINTRKVEPGKDLTLTIDSQLQLEAESVLERVGQKFLPKGASAIVMNPNNGDVLAMANWPKLDANDPRRRRPRRSRIARSVTPTSRDRLSRQSRSAGRSRSTRSLRRRFSIFLRNCRSKTASSRSRTIAERKHSRCRRSSRSRATSARSRSA